MKWPQHRDDPHFVATAPYNFVPQAEAVFVPPEPVVPHDRLDPERLHGWIDLTIRTETPFYTRCAYPPAVDPDDTNRPIDLPARQESYHHGDPEVPVIPGSTIRGAVRDLVEILTASRLTRRVEPGRGARVRDERLVYRAVADQRTPPGKQYAQRFRAVLAGWLVQSGVGEWQLEPARVVSGQSFVRVPRGKLPSTFNPEISQSNPSPGNCRVWLRIVARADGALVATDVSAASRPGWEEATIVPSGRMNKRQHFTAVFPPDPGQPVIPIPETMWRLWKDDRDLKRGLPNRKVAANNEPVFYLIEDGELTFFGPTLHFRIPFRFWTVDYVPYAARLPATAADAEPESMTLARRLDLAEALFGTVNDGHRKHGASATLPTGAHRGRVSFDDATCVSESPFLEGADGGRRYPSILSSPKPTSYQMYLVQPKALGTEKNRMKEHLLAWDAGTPDQGRRQEEMTTLRGFKRYWQRGPPPDVNGPPPEEETSEQFRAGALFRKAPTKHQDQYTRIRPVKAGVEFRGKLRFENLTHLELGALLAALELPPSCRHHLGMGKPHGMGSVLLTASVTVYDGRRRYESLAGLATRPDQESVLAAARGRFQDAMIEHHNGAVARPKLESSAALWDVPRLASLREMLEWEQRPARDHTANQSLARFRDRLPLPSPFGVQRKPAPRVEADLPHFGQGPAPTTEPVDGAAPRARPGPPRGAIATPRAEPEVESPGSVVRFTWAGVKLRTVDGSVLTVPVDLQFFPLEAWKQMRAAQFPTGRLVRIFRVGTRVVRVLPETKS